MEQLSFFAGLLSRWHSPGQPTKLAAPPPPLSPPARRQENPFIWRHGLTVLLVRNLRAKRYLLRWEVGPQRARLVVPRGGTQAEALRFLAKSEAWLLRQRNALDQAGAAAALPWTHGHPILWRGEPTPLTVRPLGIDRVELHLGPERLGLAQSQPDYREAVGFFARQLAARELPARTIELARIHAVEIRRVTVRAQRGRWGSCSNRGAISLNWRLLQAPVFVRDYVIVHELMHRREMNHSARFWRQVAQAIPDYPTAEAWLKKHERALLQTR